MKKVAGYVLDIPGGNPIVGAEVTIRDKNNGTAITTGNPASGVVNTNGDGYFEWVADFSPGPVYADAFVSTAERKRRYGQETIQVGTHWLDDLPVLAGIFSNGVITGKLNSFLVTATGITRVVTVATGHAIIEGYPWTLESGAKTLTADANTTLATRQDRVVLKQEKTGVYAGRQTLYIKHGTIAATPPTLQNDASVTEFSLAIIVTPQNGNTTVLLDERVYSTQVVAANSINSSHIQPGTVAASDLVEAYALASHTHGLDGLTIEEGASVINAAATKLRFDATAFNLTNDGANARVTVAPAFGSAAGTVAEGNHTHAIYSLTSHTHSYLPMSGGTLTGSLTAPGVTASSTLRAQDGFFHDAGALHFFGGPGQLSRPTVTGSRGGNAALTSLLTTLAGLGLITNSTSA